MARQQSFGFTEKVQKEFGGSLLRGKRKSKRPLSTRLPMHLIFKAQQARGRTSFFWCKNEIQKILDKNSKKFGVKIFDICVHSNHIHLAIQIVSRESYVRWVRATSFEVLNAIRKQTGLRLKAFFDLRPYTRIVTWGRDFKSLILYIKTNISQVESLYPKDLFANFYSS